MIQFVLETEQQQGFSAIPCTNPDSFGARIDTSQPLTEIREGDLYFCLEEREVAVQGKKVDLSVREFNALYLLLMNRRRVMTFETILRRNFCAAGGVLFSYSGAIFERPRSLSIDYSGAKYTRFPPRIVAA